MGDESAPETITKCQSENQKSNFCVHGIRQDSTPMHDSPFSWLVAISGFLCNVIILGESYSFGVLLPALLEEFNAGRATTAWIGTLATSLTFFFGPAAGKLIVRFGARVVAVAGALLALVSLLSASQAPNVPVLFVTYGLFFGIGSCCVYTSVFAIVPTYFLKWRSFSVGMIASGPGAGIFVVGPILAASVEAFGWRGALLVMASMVVMICILAGCSFRSNTPDSYAEEMTVVPGNQSKEEKDHTIHPEPKLWKNPEFVVYTACSTFLHLGNLIPTVHLASYCEEMGINQHMASRLYLTFGLCSLVTRVGTGRLCDVTRVNPQHLYQGALIVEGVSTLLCTLAKSFTGLVLYCIVLGLANGTEATCANLMILNSVPAHRRPQAYGIWLCALSVTMLIGAPLGGFMADMLGSYVPAFLWTGSIFLGSAGIICVLWCWKRQDSSRAKLVPIFLDELVVCEKLTVL